MSFFAIRVISFEHALCSIENHHEISGRCDKIYFE